MSSSVYDADCVLLAQCFSSWSSEHRSWDSPTSSPGMLPSQHSGASWLRNEALVPTWQEYWFFLMSPGPRVRQIFFFFFLHSVAPRLGKKKKPLMKMQQPKPLFNTRKAMNNNRKKQRKKHRQDSFFPWSDFITKFMRTYSITREFVNMRKTEQSRTQEFNKLVR